MSVLLEFAMFPTDKGDSVSAYVSKVIEMIRNSGCDYKLTAMGTIIETNTMEEALEIINKSYLVLEPHSNRIYSSIKFDIRKGQTGRLKKKLESIENKIGPVNI
ncbi:MAG: MTH1187 family thiamine-binding protein [Bacteroidales bacterium]|nr:MTH1187 family thiamine-binding protein [Bacteroidales bacterium]